MPMILLNSEILKEIFEQCNSDENSLAKFMMSGKQNLYIALNYFSKSEIIHTDGSKSRVTVVSGGKAIECLFSSEFLFLKSVILSSLDSVKTLFVHRNYDDEYEEENQSIFMILFGKTKIKNKDGINLMDLINKNQLFFCRNISFDTAPMVDDRLTTPHILLYPDEGSFLLKIIYNRSLKFPSVENIKIRGTLLNIGDIKQFIFFISNYFPKLKSMKILFFINPKKWDEIREFILFLNPSIFETIDSRIKGKIRIKMESFESFNVVKEVKSESDLIFDADEIFVRKSFNIHQDLSFNFSCNFFGFTPEIIEAQRNRFRFKIFQFLFILLSMAFMFGYYYYYA